MPFGIFGGTKPKGYVTKQAKKIWSKHYPEEQLKYQSDLVIHESKPHILFGALLIGVEGFMYPIGGRSEESGESLPTPSAWYNKPEFKEVIYDCSYEDVEDLRLYIGKKHVPYISIELGEEARNNYGKDKLEFWEWEVPGIRKTSEEKLTFETLVNFKEGFDRRIGRKPLSTAERAIRKFISRYYSDEEVRYTYRSVWNYQFDSNGEVESCVHGAIGLLDERFLFLESLGRISYDYKRLLHDISYEEIENVCIYSERWKPRIPIDTLTFDDEILILDLLSNLQPPHLIFRVLPVETDGAKKTCSMIKQLKEEFDRSIKHV